MAYAAYRENPGVIRSCPTTSFHVLDVTVACADARSVRQDVARCPAWCAVSLCCMSAARMKAMRRGYGS
jgi:hypothetical protein